MYITVYALIRAHFHSTAMYNVCSAPLSPNSITLICRGFASCTTNRRIDNGHICRRLLRKAARVRHKLMVLAVHVPSFCVLTQKVIIKQVIGFIIVQRQVRITVETR